MPDNDRPKWDEKSAEKMKEIILKTGLVAASKECGADLTKIEGLDDAHIAREAIKRNMEGNESR